MQSFEILAEFGNGMGVYPKIPHVILMETPMTVICPQGIPVGECSDIHAGWCTVPTVYSTILELLYR